MTSVIAQLPSNFEWLLAVDLFLTLADYGAAAP